MNMNKIYNENVINLNRVKLACLKNKYLVYEN